MATKASAPDVLDRLNNIHGALALAALVASIKGEEYDHSGRLESRWIEHAGWRYLSTVMQDAFWDQRALEEALPTDAARLTAPDVERDDEGAS